MDGTIFMKHFLSFLIGILLLTSQNSVAHTSGYDFPGAEIESLAQQQSSTVTGKVVDSEGLGMPGVNVVEKGTTNGVVTNIGGMFSLSLTGENPVLVFSFIGYLSQEVRVGSQKEFQIILLQDIKSLDEVMVVGYGVQKKATLSGSVSSAKGEEIAKVPAMNVTNALGGKLPGLVAIAQSGEPGADYATLYIRGRSTLNDNSPLIVVDGVPNRSLERIDPASIESVTILKDASGAIYGSQAANGVVLVTTKRGSSDKMDITAHYSAGFSQPTRIPEMANSAEYSELVNEVMLYRNRPPAYSSEDIQNYKSRADLWRYPDTDWYKQVLKPWSLQNIANLTMSGGNERIRSFVSVSSRSQDGFFRNSASKYNQQDIRANIDNKVNNSIDVSLDASFRLENRDFPTASSANIFKDLTSARPMQVAFWPSGEPGPPLDPTVQNNPAVQAKPDAGLLEGENYVFNVNSKVNIKIPWVQGLTFTATGSIDRGINYTKSFSKRYELFSWNGTTVNDQGIPILTSAKYGQSDMRQQTEISKQHLVNGYFTYQRKFNEIHNVNLTAGLELIENNFNWFSAQRLNFTQNYPAELNFGDANQQYASGSNPGTNRWKNYFGRVNYSFKEKYIAEFVWRYQGSSKFHHDTRWGFFPGVSLAYRISEEKFFADHQIANLINDLKIRTSYGKTGNDLIPPYQFFSLYGKSVFSFVTGNGTYNPIYFEALAGNAKAQWEEADQYNIGFDIRLFDSRLSLTADYFNNMRSKILISQTASVPDMTGASGKLPKINLGKVRNFGFDVEANWYDKVGSLFYSIGLNILNAQNKVLFFDEAEGALPWQKQTGYPMESGLYYISKGIFQSQDQIDSYPHIANARPGDVIFEDVSGDGKINGDDMKRIYKNIVPTWTGGLNLSAKYKMVDLSMMVQGQAGAVRYTQYTGSAGGQNYFKTFYDNRWNEQNTDAKWPRTFNRNDEYWVSSSNPNTFWLRKTDFIRLKNIELGFTLPDNFCRKLKLNDIRIFAGGMNLFVWSPDMVDFDPEMESKGDGFAGQGYPLQRIINTGITVKF